MPSALAPIALVGVDPSHGIHRFGGETMGTRWHIALAAPVGFDTGPIAAAVTARLAILVTDLSHWEPDSAVSRFNHASAGSWHVLPRDLAIVVDAGVAVARASGGAFDPAIGALVELWGYGPSRCPAPPVADAVEAALATAGYERITRAGDALRQPGGAWLDLSGIGKGHAVDVIADLLATHGHAHMLVEIGGELAGRGMRPDGDPWWVDLETPFEATPPPIRVALHQLAVATSGDYVRGAHTLDPRTGIPVANGMAAVSVLHDSAMLADAWASALTVLGPEEAEAVAVREGLAARLVWRGGDRWHETLTPALAAML